MFSDKKFNLPNKLIEASRLVMEERELDALYSHFIDYLEENYHVDQLTEEEIAFIFEQDYSGAGKESYRMNRKPDYYIGNIDGQIDKNSKAKLPGTFAGRYDSDRMDNANRLLKNFQNKYDRSATSGVQVDPSSTKIKPAQRVKAQLPNDRPALGDSMPGLKSSTTFRTPTTGNRDVSPPGGGSEIGKGLPGVSAEPGAGTEYKQAQDAFKKLNDRPALGDSMPGGKATQTFGRPSTTGNRDVSPPGGGSEIGKPPTPAAEKPAVQPSARPSAPQPQRRAPRPSSAPSGGSFSQYPSWAQKAFQGSGGA